MKKILVTLALIVSLIGAPESQAMWRCIRDLATLAGLSNNVPLTPDEKGKVNIAIDTNAIRRKDFRKLYYSDGLSFADAVEAARAIKNGTIRLRHYRDLRAFGLSHHETMSGLGVGAMVGGLPSFANRTAMIAWMSTSGIGSVEAADAMADFEKRLGFAYRIPFFNQVFTALVRSAVQDYVALRKAEIPREQAIQVAWEADAKEYLKLQKAGIGHEDALEVAWEGDAEKYLDARNYKVSHDEAMEAIRQGVEDDYLALIRGGVPHANAIEAAAQYESGEYLRARETGATHEEILEVLAIGDVDLYANLRSNKIGHEDAVDITETYGDAGEYLQIRNGDFKVSHDEAREIMDSYDVGEYVDLRQIDLSHNEAVEVLENGSFDTSDYVRLRRAGIPHEESMDALEELDADTYLRIRRNRET